MSQGVVCQPPNYLCCTKYPDMLTLVHLISDFLCDRFDWTCLFLDEGIHFSSAIVFPTILAIYFRPSHTVILKASPLACRTQSSLTLAAAATTTRKMAKNKDNNNDKDKDLPQDERERRQRVREERERRRALASAGKEDLVVNPPALNHLFRHANSPATASSSSATDTQRAPHPHPSSAAALDAAAAIPLPGNDDDDLDSDQLLASEEEAGEDPPPYEDDEEGMDVDVSEPPTTNRKWNVSVVKEAPKPGELDVGPSRAWIPTSLKDGTNPTSVREIAIQCDYGGASLARRRKHMIASRRRHDRKRREQVKAEKSSAREAGRQHPHPDAEADQVTPSQPAAALPQPGSGGGPAPLAAPRRGEEKPPAKKAKPGPPSKKKEVRMEEGPRFSPVRAPVPGPEKQVQPSSSSGGSRAPRRQVEFHASTQPNPAPKPGPSRKEEAPRHRYKAPQKRYRSPSHGPHYDSSTAKMIEVFVRGMSEAFRASRGYDRSPSPRQRYSGDYRNGSRHHYHHDDRASFEREEEEEERGRSGSRRRSRSRSQSRGRSRDRRPPPYRGKGKGRGKGRGK